MQENIYYLIIYSSAQCNPDTIEIFCCVLLQVYLLQYT